MTLPSPFVSTQWLSDNLDNKDVSIVDASWYLPSAQRNPEAEFEDIHIPGAIYFDLDKIADTSIDLPHMVASPERFGEMVGKLGISHSDIIVIYDSAGLLSAARVWWNFSMMGAKNCFVLAGGLPRWLEEKRPTESGPANPVRRSFKAERQEEAVVTAGQLLAHINETPDPAIAQIVDVRPAARFAGTAPEPRTGLSSGHMPDSFNLPFGDLIFEGALRSPDEIRALFENAGIDLNKPIVSSCGSGVTAPILNLALHSIGIKAWRVYDGSWAEWGADPDLPVIGDKGKLI
ncbi:3-mercaptopyruvate sulfurtransferase [hydrothermal vent metagenome]|uniref:3-mercaptopyruvate sulfurtransferase n=1 Tax=hydrothermal vent metagenome TaxID=652676 RepID=A0A3B0TNK0_9ZZZZ